MMLILVGRTAVIINGDNNLSPPKFWSAVAKKVVPNL